MSEKCCNSCVSVGFCKIIKSPNCYEDHNSFYCSHHKFKKEKPELPDKFNQKFIFYDENHQLAGYIQNLMAKFDELIDYWAAKDNA